MFQLENIDTESYNGDDNIFVSIVNDSLSIPSDPNSIHYESYVLLITNMFSTYLSESTRLHNLLENGHVYKDYDIIFIGNDANDFNAALAYQQMLPGLLLCYF